MSAAARRVQELERTFLGRTYPQQPLAAAEIKAALAVVDSITPETPADRARLADVESELLRLELVSRLRRH